MSKKIAITGGIGSGKTTVSNLIKEKGYPVYSCDEIYKELIESTIYIKEIEKAFPAAIKQGKIDKKSLAEIIFSNKQERKRLNEIAHPLIMEALLDRMNKNENKLVFAEVPLLVEGGYENDFDERIVIMRPLDEKIVSVCKRDKTDRERVLSRIQSQLNYEDKNVLAFLKSKKAIIINNVGTEQDLKDKIFSLLPTLS